MFKWLFGSGAAPEPAAPAPAPVSMSAFPAAINLSGQPQIEQALYRLDQIARHWEQHSISETKQAEFESEAALHVVSLRAAFAKFDHEAAKDALTAQLDGYVARLKACGWKGTL